MKDDDFDTDNPSYNWWQSLLIIGFVLALGAWWVSDDLREAGLLPEETLQPYQTTKPASAQEDADNVHYLLLTIARNQNAANEAYDQARIAVKSVNREGLLSAIKALDYGVVRMANAKVEKTKMISNASARESMREGLHLFWQINTVRRNYYKDALSALNSSYPAQDLQAVVQKYKDVIPNVPDVALQATLYFIQAKQSVGLPSDLSEFK